MKCGVWVQIMEDVHCATADRRPQNELIQTETAKVSVFRRVQIPAGQQLEGNALSPVRGSRDLYAGWLNVDETVVQEPISREDDNVYSKDE